MAVVVGLGLSGPAATSQALPPSQAPDCSGVTVVVDFNALGGGEPARCAPGDPSSGVAALRGAGFTPTRAAQEAGYFLCRIDGKPADDPCQRASPANAYWSYWHAQPGGTWQFSNAGPASYDPAPGTVEGWSFGAGEPPSTPPPSRQQASRSPAATASARATPATSAPPRLTASRTAGSAVAPSLQPPAADGSGRPTARGSVSPSATGSATPSVSASPQVEPSSLAVDQPSSPPDEGSPLLGVLLAGAVVASLGAAAAYQAQKRR